MYWADGEKFNYSLAFGLGRRFTKQKQTIYGKTYWKAEAKLSGVWVRVWPHIAHCSPYQWFVWTELLSLSSEPWDYHQLALQPGAQVVSDRSAVNGLRTPWRASLLKTRLTRNFFSNTTLHAVSILIAFPLLFISSTFCQAYLFIRFPMHQNYY